MHFLRRTSGSLSGGARIGANVVRMSERSPASRERRLTPNQLAKRREIVEVAKRLLANHGLAGCTSRQIAAAGHLTKSVIHYYFSDMDVLVAAAASANDPLNAFWNMIDAYLATFRDQPHVTYLWLEYWVDASRKGRVDAIAALNDRITAMLEEELGACGNPRPRESAKAVFTYLLGAILDQTVNENAVGKMTAHIATLAGVGPRPRPRSPRRATAKPV